MVATITTYGGDLHCTATHEPSGATMSTDAPKDNHGRGESFSPTDLMGTALGSCILSIMGITANRLGVNIEGATARVEKTMASDPRRIAQLAVHITLPNSYDARAQTTLERAALACPVKKSLHPDMDIPIVFEWGSA